MILMRLPWVNYVGTFSDITEKMEMEAERSHAQRMEAIGSLVGGVAHNFNNILAGMVGKLYLANQKAQSAPEVLPYLKSLEQLSDQAAGIVRQLLTFARKEVTEKRDIPIVPLMKEALKTSRLGVPETIQLLGDFGDEPLTVYGDAAQLQQVLMNMINNARDAMTDAMPRTISVSLRRFPADEYFVKRHAQLSGKELLCLSIEDSGSGIEAADLEHIFEPFFSTKEVGKGTGLGLSMSKGAIESHGGTIEVDSTVGKGTVFRIYLPLVATESKVEAPHSLEVLQGEGELILLVDDEEMVIESIKAVLEAIGYRVLTASNGARAFGMFMEHQKDIDLIITDIIMPEMGGYELVQKVRQHSDLPIVLLTGYDYAQKNKDNDPSVTTISKPFNVQKLSVILAGFLHKN